MIQSAVWKKTENPEKATLNAQSGSENTSMLAVEMEQAVEISRSDAAIPERNLFFKSGIKAWHIAEKNITYPDIKSD